MTTRASAILGLGYAGMLDGLVSWGVPREAAERAAAAEMAKRAGDQAGDQAAERKLGLVKAEAVLNDVWLDWLDNPRQRVSGRSTVRVGSDRFAICPATFSRVCDTLTATLGLPPRTKKNHGRFFGVKQSAAYCRYRDAIVEAVKSANDELRSDRGLGLPLPDQPYNIAAVYFVDKPGERADKVGLDQGLYDALENAGVVRNDWWFRTADGTRVVFGDSHPRVELTISPIEDP